MNYSLCSNAKKLLTPYWRKYALQSLVYFTPGEWEGVNRITVENSVRLQALLVRGVPMSNDDARFVESVVGPLDVGAYVLSGMRVWDHVRVWFCGVTDTGEGILGGVLFGQEVDEVLEQRRCRLMNVWSRGVLCKGVKV